MTHTIFTIGHSNRTLDEFLELLRDSGITAIVDVRARPYSRYVPHFSREVLAQSLSGASVEYYYLGDQLGAHAHPRDLAREPGFEQGLDRVVRLASEHQVALMCSEKDPLACHRGILIAHKLALRGETVTHIGHDPAPEHHRSLEQRMLPEQNEQLGFGADYGTPKLTDDERLQQAYREAEDAIAPALEQADWGRKLT